MGVNMPKITISGYPGSGTSTLVSGLVNHFNWQSINGGQIFRDEASKRGLTLAEFGKLCVDDESVDKELDEGGSLEDVLEANAKRLAIDNQRYQNMYGLTPDDPLAYTHIIEASNISAEEVLSQAIKILERK